MAIVYLALGSNLGDRQSYIEQAIVQLGLHGILVQKVSTIIETNPAAGPTQGKYLNGVLKGWTAHSPEELHYITKQIEKKIGRTKKVLNGPRLIDIDILLYDDIKLVTKRLVIPHLRIWERDFVMKPLKEIAPEIYKEVESGY